MHDLYRVRKALLAIDVPGRWSSERRQSKEAAVATDYTSVRLTKKTLAGLQHLAFELSTGGNWYRRNIPLTELLEWIATGIIVMPDRRLVRACKRAIVKKHAKSDVGKGMQSRRPRRVHAGGDR